MAIGSTDAEVRKIINESHDEAKRLLTVYRKQLDALAEALVARETLNEQEVLRVTELPPARPLDTGMVLPHRRDGEKAAAPRGNSAA